MVLLQTQNLANGTELQPGPVIEQQHTIDSTVTVEGPGLFSGHPGKAVFHPAPANHGIVFVCPEHGGVEIPALVRHVVKRTRRTTLRVGDAVIETCEHCLSAVAALGIDNLLIEVEGPELPGLDTSPKQYLEALTQAGLRANDAPRQRVVITQPVVVRQDDAMLVALPSDQPALEITYDLDYGPRTVVGRQHRTFSMSNGDYASQIAPARTFVLEAEVQALRAGGIGTHLTEEDVLVIGEQGPLGGNKMRFSDEPVRHKIADLIGDLYLLGAPIQGRIIAYKSGHSLNHALVRRLIEMQRHQRRSRLAVKPKNLLDIRKLSRILPHRYPMLLVDRVIEIDPDKRVVGIKNVTINEPFFQGHYPGAPIMPGVLIVEAMAQLSGVLVGQTLEHTGKLAVLLSLDRVKLRRPVTPGDQLVMEAQAVRVRSRIAHLRCRAYVADDLAAEAEVKFMLVDDEQD